MVAKGNYNKHQLEADSWIFNAFFRSVPSIIKYDMARAFYIDYERFAKHRAYWAFLLKYHGILKHTFIPQPCQDIDKNGKCQVTRLDATNLGTKRWGWIEGASYQHFTREEWTNIYEDIWKNRQFYIDKWQAIEAEQQLENYNNTFGKLIVK